jgi:lactate dehydrogenase-like 2-hydroxyacid dehydrogenase
MKKNTIGIVGLGKIGNAVARGFAGAKLDVRPQQVHPFLYFFDRHHHQQL